MRFASLMALTCIGTAAHAAPGDPAPTSEPTSTGPELTPEELRAIEDSLGAPAPAPAPTSGFLQSMNPDISLLLDVAAAWFSDDDPQQLGGHDPARNGFTLQQLELHLGANVDPFFRLDGNLVFGEDGVEVEEAYATTMAIPGGLQLKAGTFLTRFGRRNPTHPHQWAFLDQALAIGKFLGEDGARGLGLEVSWLTPLPWYVELVGSVQGASGECCMRSFQGESDPGIRGLDDFLYMVALKQFFDLSDDWGLQWGLSAMLGPNAYGRRTGIYGTDLFLRYKPVGAAGRTSVDLLVEIMLRTRDVADLAEPPAATNPRTLVDWGLFAELRWQIDAEWGLALRHDLVTGVDDDPLDPEWTGLRNRTALAWDFWPSHFSRLRLQGGVDRSEWRDDLAGFVMLGLEVGIGAHGAHNY